MAYGGLGMDYSVSAAVSARLSKSPVLVWGLLLLLIGCNALLSLWLSGAWKPALICFAFLIKGLLVIDYLMGLKTAPRWIRWPMLSYFYVFSAVLLVAFIV